MVETVLMSSSSAKFCYIILLSMILVLVNKLIASNRAKAQAVKILQTKYDLGQQLEAMLDGEQLNQKIMETLVSIIHPEGALLLTYCELSGNFEESTQWKPAGQDAWNDWFCQQLSAPQTCATNQVHRLHLGHFQFPEALPVGKYSAYCLPLVYGDTWLLLAILLPQGG
jgi:hypothetical protein